MESSKKKNRMGKRKSSRAKQVTKKRLEKLHVEFDCSFCSHRKAVECEIDKKYIVGTISCRICEVGYLVTLTPLTEPVDMYAEWIDECEQVNALHDDDYDNDRSESTRFKKIQVEV